MGFSYQNPLRPTGLTILFFVDDKFSKSRLSENLKNPDIARVIYAEEFEKQILKIKLIYAMIFIERLMVVTQALLDS